MTEIEKKGHSGDMSNESAILNPEAASLPTVLQSLQPRVAKILESNSAATAVGAAIDILKSIVRVDFIVIYLKPESERLELSGYTGLSRIIRAGAVPIPIIQKHINKWYSVALDLFGGDHSSSAH